VHRVDVAEGGGGDDDGQRIAAGWTLSAPSRRNRASFTGVTASVNDWAAVSNPSKR
jgi:hypothetical protein